MKHLKYFMNRLRVGSPGAFVCHACYPGINIRNVFFYLQISPGLSRE